MQMAIWTASLLLESYSFLLVLSRVGVGNARKQQKIERLRKHVLALFLYENEGLKQIICSFLRKRLPPSLANALLR